MMETGRCILITYAVILCPDRGAVRCLGQQRTALEKVAIFTQCLESTGSSVQ